MKATLARYLAEVTPSKSPSTQVTDRRRANTLATRLGGFPLAAITPTVVAEYRDQRLITQSRYGRNISATHVRLELALLSHVYTIAIQEWGLGLPQNPVALVRKPKPAAGRDRRLSKQEEGRLLEECERYSNPMLYWIVVLAIETGMRKGEMVTLTRRQIDLQKRMIYLQQTKNGAARSVPLSKTAVQVLEAAINHPVRPIDTDLVFWGDARDKVSSKRTPYDFIGAWNQVREKVRLRDLRFHDLRHEAVSRLVEAGLSDQEVSTISGHKSMQTLKRYTHLRAEDLVAKLDRAFRQQ